MRKQKMSTQVLLACLPLAFFSHAQSLANTLLYRGGWILHHTRTDSLKILTFLFYHGGCVLIWCQFNSY